MTAAGVVADLPERADGLLSDYRARVAPWELFAELRETAPVLQTASGVWLVSRYADCQALLRDRRLSRKLAAARTSALGGAQAEQYTTRLVCEDGADHRRMRSVVNVAFSARNIQRWHPRITEVAGEVFATFADKRAMEFLNDYARPVPVRVLSDVLGVPYGDRATLESWMGVLLEHVTGDTSEEFRRERHEAMSGLASYLGELIDERRSGPLGDDLISILIQARETEGRLSERELIGILAELLHAGYESTATALAGGLLCLLQHPRQARILADDPSLASSAAEEALRFSPPTALRLPRIATEAIELDSGIIPAGAMVLALTASANHDPAAFDDPEVFDITRRRDNGHLSFGLGEHYCIGNGLARAELTAVFELLARTCLRSMRLDGPVVYRDHHIIRGLEALAVAW